MSEQITTLVERCAHELPEREDACADGMCPQCLSAALKQAESDKNWLRAQRDVAEANAADRLSLLAIDRAALSTANARTAELENTVAHLEFEVDGAALDLANLEAQLDPAFREWFAALPVVTRAEIKSYVLHDLFNRRRIERLSEALKEIAETFEIDWHEAQVIARNAIAEGE